MKLLGLVRALALLLFFCRCASAAPFQATPLTDFSPDEKYLGSFPGFLYNGSNTLSSTLSTHDQEGRAFASKVQPLNDQGQPDPNGTIVVVGIGQSNWTMDLCARVHKSDTTLPACTAASFIAHADAVDNPKVRIIDCASGGQTANLWFDDSFGNWSRCDGLLANEGLTPAQVQVILWRDVNGLGATVSLSPTTNCSVLTTFDNSTPDVCKYIRRTGQVARFAKQWFPHIQQMFLHAAGYSGYAPGHEPFSYENGFGVKWIVQAQIDQIASGTISNLAAGDLSYAVAPWMAWGPYFWASDSTPRSDGLVWLPSDYLSDMIHPSQSGVLKVTKKMMSWYFTSPYTPWIK
jgi:hypothetical protein